MLVAGPFDARHTLSELVIHKKQVQNHIKSLIGDSEARLEFFCVEESERELSRILQISAYCNFDFSIPFSKKILFKTLCGELDIRTPPWFFEEDLNLLFAECQKQLKHGTRFLLKSDSGTGGLPCGSMFLIDSEAALESAITRISP